MARLSMARLSAALLVVGGARALENSPGCLFKSDPDFNDDTIPTAFYSSACCGDDKSPPLEWDVQVPGFLPNNDTLAIIIENVVDRIHVAENGTSDSVNWIMWNLPIATTFTTNTDGSPGTFTSTRKDEVSPATSGMRTTMAPIVQGKLPGNLPAGAFLPDGVTRQGTNSYGHVGYTPICPTNMEGPRLFYFNLYILRGIIDTLHAGSDVHALRGAMADKMRSHCAFSGYFPENFQCNPRTGKSKKGGKKVADQMKDDRVAQMVAGSIAALPKQRMKRLRKEKELNAAATVATPKKGSVIAKFARPRQETLSPSGSSSKPMETEPDPHFL